MISAYSSPAEVAEVVARAVSDGVLDADSFMETFWLDSGGSLHASSACQGVTGERVVLDLRDAVSAFSASWCDCAGVIGSAAGSLAAVAAEAYAVLDARRDAVPVDSWAQAAAWLEMASPDAPFWSGTLGTLPAGLDVLVHGAIDAAVAMAVDACRSLPVQELHEMIAAPGLELTVSAHRARDVQHWLSGKRIAGPLGRVPLLRRVPARPPGEFDLLLRARLARRDGPHHLLLCASRRGMPALRDRQQELALLLLTAGEQLDGQVWWLRLDDALGRGAAVLLEERPGPWSLAVLPDAAGDALLRDTARLWDPTVDGPFATAAGAYDAAARL